jgi:mTERF domain-containing protein
MIVAASKRCAVFLTYDWKSIIQPNVELLIKEGVPEERVVKMIVAQPRIIYQRRDRMVYAVNAVKNLGLEPKAPMFIYALRSILSMNEFTWKKKIEVMKSFGWTEEEILRAFKQYPFQLSSSEEKMRKSMDFLLNTIKMERQAIIACPKFLMYSTEKRLRPRYDVLKILKSKKLIEIGKKTNYLLTVSEKNFLENYVTKYADKVPGLLEVYRGTTKTER